MKALSVSWNEQSDITNITLNERFRQADKIVRLDVLRDVIGMLSIEYDFLLNHNMANAQELHKNSPKQFSSNQLQRGQEGYLKG